MRVADKWVGISEAMPAMGQKVFVYSENAKKVQGPVHLQVLQGSDSKYVIGQDFHFPAGPKISDVLASNNIFAIYWFQGGQVFDQFMPTHWASFPELPTDQQS